jgi:hypothetical protein
VSPPEPASDRALDPILVGLVVVQRLVRERDEPLMQELRVRFGGGPGRAGHALGLEQPLECVDALREPDLRPNPSSRAPGVGEGVDLGHDTDRAGQIVGNCIGECGDGGG